MVGNTRHGGVALRAGYYIGAYMSMLPKSGQCVTILGMAKKTILIDDLDGSDGASPRTFAIGGKTYDIDLNDDNYNQLLDLLEPYVSVGSVRRGAATVNVSSDAREIRAWAEDNGLLKPASKGRVPHAVREAYRKR